MGLIGRILGVGTAGAQLGETVERVAEVFVPNKTKANELDYKRHTNALDQYKSEYSTSQGGKFNEVVNALNRLPRPTLALGTVGLFGYSMVDPTGFSGRMTGLQSVPEPLWWLLGAIVSFYFGAREMHYSRKFIKPNPASVAAPVKMATQPHNSPQNAALSEWNSLQ